MRNFDLDGKLNYLSIKYEIKNNHKYVIHRIDRWSEYGVMPYANGKRNYGGLRQISREMFSVYTLNANHRETMWVSTNWFVPGKSSNLLLYSKLHSNASTIDAWFDTWVAFCRHEYMHSHKYRNQRHSTKSNSVHVWGSHAAQVSESQNAFFLDYCIFTGLSLVVITIYSQNDNSLKRVASNEHSIKIDTIIRLLHVQVGWRFEIILYFISWCS